MHYLGDHYSRIILPVVFAAQTIREILSAAHVETQ